MTRAELVSRVQLYISANSTQQSTEFSSAAFIQFVQDAYTRLWNRIRYSVNSAGNVAKQDIVWPQGQSTLTLQSAGLVGKELMGFYFINGDGTTGQRFDVRFQDPQTLMWVSNPQFASFNTAQNMRVYYRVTAEKLTSDSSTPVLLNPEHHEAIVYEALIQIKEIEDQNVPESWVARRDDLEFYATKSLTNKIFRNQSRIVPDDLDTVVWMA
jgi:hypothetical protein